MGGGRKNRGGNRQPSTARLSLHTKAFLPMSCRFNVTSLPWVVFCTWVMTCPRPHTFFELLKAVKFF